MFQYILAGLATAVFGGIAIHEATKPTGEKVQEGDAVFVRADALHPVDLASPGDDIGLRAFLAGFLSTAVKVTSVVPAQSVNAASSGKELVGTIIGFPKSVQFPRTAVVSIERKGRRIT